MLVPSQSSSTPVGSSVSSSNLSDGDSLLWLQEVGGSGIPFILPLIITSLLDLTPYSDGLSWEELEPVGLKLHNWFTANCGHQGRSVTISLVMTPAAVRRPWLALLPLSYGSVQVPYVPLNVGLLLSWCQCCCHWSGYSCHQPRDWLIKVLLPRPTIYAHKRVFDEYIIFKKLPIFWEL